LIYLNNQIPTKVSPIAVQLNPLDAETVVRQPQMSPLVALVNLLRMLLEEMFKQIISWSKEDLKPMKCKYFRWTKYYTKEEFKRQQEQYPIPKIE
jgi:hypothetical protein